GTHRANLAGSIEAIRAGAAEAGRDPASVRLGAVFHTVLVDDAARALTMAKSMAAGYYEYSPMLFARPGLQCTGPTPAEPQGGRRLLQHRGPFAPLQVVAIGARELLDDLAALSEEAPRFLSAREEERAEPQLVAQAPRADQIPIRDQTPERKREEEGHRPGDTGGPSDERRLERPEERECDDAREKPSRRVVRLPARRPPRAPSREVVRKEVHGPAVREER